VDDIDRRLLKALERNPRITCKQLYKNLGISIPSVWKRMSSLEGSEVIGGFCAIIGQEALGVVRVTVHGRMEGMMDDGALKAIEDNDSIYTAITGSQNSLYLLCGLRQISELDDVLKVAQIDCRIADPQALIIGPGSILGISTSIDKKDRPSIETIKDLDWLIIWSLHNNARKPASDVARELGISTKTVKRRLARLIEDELIEFYVIGKIQRPEELYFQVFVKLKSVAFRKNVQSIITRDYSSFVDNCIVFSNHPDLVNFDMITKSTAELKEILADLRGIEGVESITWDLLLETYEFANWVEGMPEEKAREIRKKT
jgi:DNA-binding Lrp family transcriptional regulator